MPTETLPDRRRRLMGPDVPTFYQAPVHIVRGQGVWLWDESGQRYLDCYNNVPHVGHCHPHVVEAMARQSSLLNVHTRYLHDGILDYIDRLTSTLDDDLSQMIPVCTGSEANDIALRMAQAVTGNTGIIATDCTYHGNTTATAQLSARRPPIGGFPAHVRLVPPPDSLAPLGGSGAAQPETLAYHVRKAIDELSDAGFGIAAIMLCPAFANEGLPSLPADILAPTVDVVRRAGGLILCDEVQPGFGRLGRHFWGHARLGLSPDVVTIGKPMANGYPMAAVVARPDIMAAFRNSFGYFNTFGGNPVAAAAGHAVLDVLENEALQANAEETGAYAIRRLQQLDHPLIAECRGMGLFLALEFRHADGRPATAFTGRVVETMRERGVLLNATCRHMNALKLRPPMPFSRVHVDQAIDTLADVLNELSDAE